MDNDDDERASRESQSEMRGDGAQALFGPFTVRGPGVQIILDGRPISWPNDTD